MGVFFAFVFSDSPTVFVMQLCGSPFISSSITQILCAHMPSCKAPSNLPPLKDVEAWSQYLRHGPLSPWQCAVQHRHCPLSKQHFLDEQRQACLLLVSRYFQGDCQLGEGSLKMICSSQVSDVNRRTLWFCKLSSQIITASQVPVKRWQVEGGWQKVIKNSLFFCHL